MATKSVQTIIYAGIEGVYTQCATADKVLAGAATFLHFKNGSGAPITVTVATPGTVDGLAIADPTAIVAAGGERFVGPLAVGTFGDADDARLVALSYSDVTSLTFAALTL